MSTRPCSGAAEFRPRTVHRLALALAAAVALAPANGLTAVQASRTTITVRVYQTVALPSTLEQRVMLEAQTVLRAARVDVRWRTCAARRACDGPIEPSELVLHIVPGEDTREVELGNALVVHPGGGVLATVYFRPVARMSRVAGIDVAVLLGRVAAHELGHLMMRTPGHARRGLMRPNWTLSEVRRNREADWTFTETDIAAMRPALTTRPRVAPDTPGRSVR